MRGRPARSRTAPPGFQHRLQNPAVECGAPQQDRASLLLNASYAAVDDQVKRKVEASVNEVLGCCGEKHQGRLLPWDRWRPRRRIQGLTVPGVSRLERGGTGGRLERPAGKPWSEGKPRQEAFETSSLSPKSPGFPAEREALGSPKPQTAGKAYRLPSGSPTNRSSDLPPACFMVRAPPY